MRNTQRRVEIANSKIGTTQSEESNRKRSLYQSGDKCHLWKGGISFEPYSPEFNKSLKIAVRKRDNYTYQECGVTEETLGHKLDLHHIDYDKKHNVEDNLITLCRS